MTLRKNTKVSVLPLLILLSAGLAVKGTPASAQLRGTFVAISHTTVPRSQHTATLLADGRVLITGGSNALSSAELYDPAAGKFSLTGSMTAGRRGHTATLLDNGKVLIAGGWKASAELYDPVTGTFAATGPMLEDQGKHSATLLPSGKVLMAGGLRSGASQLAVARPQLYDPASGTFSFAGNHAGSGTLYAGSGGPVWPTANLLPDGRVLIVANNPPEIYDPITDTFRLTGAMPGAEYRFGMFWHSGTSLSDGTVLIAGGNDDWSCGGINHAEIYDPSSNSFSLAGPGHMTSSRDLHTATLLRDGSVLLTGGGDGWCGISTLDTAEIYDPATRSFMDAGKMTRSRTDHTATLLKDGTVLIVGGISYWPSATTGSAEIYRPSVLTSMRTRAVRP